MVVGAICNLRVVNCGPPGERAKESSYGSGRKKCWLYREDREEKEVKIKRKEEIKKPFLHRNHGDQIYFSFLYLCVL